MCKAIRSRKRLAQEERSSRRWSVNSDEPLVMAARNACMESVVRLAGNHRPIAFFASLKTASGRDPGLLP